MKEAEGKTHLGKPSLPGEQQKEGRQTWLAEMHNASSSYMVVNQNLSEVQYHPVVTCLVPHGTPPCTLTFCLIQLCLMLF